MAQLVKVNEATAAKRRLFFFLVQAGDGKTPYVGASGLQPSISVNGGVWTTTGVGTLNHLGNGTYYADVNVSQLSAHAVIQGFYGLTPGFNDTNVYPTPSLNMLQVVDSDPYLYKSDFTLADLWGYGSRTLTSLGSSTIQSIWDFALTSITLAGSVGKLIKDNVDAQISSRSNFNAGTDQVTLAPTGLDNITITEFTGRATNFRQMVVQLYMRFFNKVTQDATQQKVYKSDDVTVSVTMTTSESGGTQTKGKAS